MKQLLGLILIILALPMALYVGLWLCFIGGIVQVVEGVKATPVEALSIAIGLAKFFCSSVVGILAFWGMFLPGIGLFLHKQFR